MNRQASEPQHFGYIYTHDIQVYYYTDLVTPVHGATYLNSNDHHYSTVDQVLSVTLCLLLSPITTLLDACNNVKITVVTPSGTGNVNNSKQLSVSVSVML